MVQSHSVSALADANLVEWVALHDPLALPFGVADSSGLLLYLNPSFQRLLQNRGCDASLPLRRLFEFPEHAANLFDTSGRLRFDKLPFAGHSLVCGDSSRSGKSPRGLLRLEPFHGMNQSLEVVLVSFAPVAEPKPSPLPMFQEWKSRVEEICDSFDLFRVGAKVCKVIEDLCQAKAVSFYYFCVGATVTESGRWERAEQLGDLRCLRDAPEQFEAAPDWVRVAEERGPVWFSELKRALRQRGHAPLPAWLDDGHKGFVLPCLYRGDLLGLVVVWTDMTRSDLDVRQDLIELVSFQAALAIDHARWFIFASRSDSRSAEMIENANAIILGLDLQGKVTLWNRKGRQLLGYGNEEILGRSPFHLFGSTDAEERGARDHFMHAMESGNPLTDYESRMVDKQGVARHVVWNTNILFSPQGSPMGLYAIGQDVTHRRELERNLESSERRYRNLVETTHDLYWILSCRDAQDIDKGRVLFLNRAFAGRPREELVGRGATALRETFVHDSWKIFRRACEETLAARQPVQHVETEHNATTPESTSRVFLTHDIFPYYEDNELIGVQVLSIDNTERRNIEAQMLQAQKLESVGTLARGIAHDFNNVLNGINGFTYLIQRGMGDAEKVAQHSKAIIELTRRASGLTRQLQAYARGGVFEKRPLDLNDIIRQTVKMLGSGIARNLDVRLDLDEELEWIEGDRSQIDQVLMNLCINAAEAMPDGGVLTLRTGRQHLAKSDPNLPANTAPGDYVLAQVSDTGVGMTPQVKARIFDPFYTTKKTGNGLGLSAVYGILKGHGAWIKVDSEVNVGSCFTLRFPAVKAKQNLMGEQAGLIRGGNETVMVVDDEEPVRMVAEDILSTLGYRVILAEDGEEAVRIFQERPQSIDLVMMDMAMPKLNGKAAAKAMRMLRPDLKVLFSSGYNDSSHLEILSESGFHHFLPKPFSMLDLQGAVRKTLDADSADL